VTGLGPGHVTTGIRGLGMTKRTRDLAKRGTGGVTGGNGQVTRLADGCGRRGRRITHLQKTSHNEHAEVRGRTEAVTTGRNCHA
jgi:hypothetical protein